MNDREKAKEADLGLFFKVALFQETSPALKRLPLRMGTLCIYLDLILYKYY